MKFYTRLPFNGNNVADMEISIPRYTHVDADDKYILWNKIPVCTLDSKVARDYFVWADDGYEVERAYYEDVILFNPRIKQWTEEVPIYDEHGNIIGHNTVIKEGRYTPLEVEYMFTNFPQFFDNIGVVIFNKYFYRQSDIKEVKALAEYLNR